MGQELANETEPKQAKKYLQRAYQEGDGCDLKKKNRIPGRPQKLAEYDSPKRKKKEGWLTRRYTGDQNLLDALNTPLRGAVRRLIRHERCNGNGADPKLWRRAKDCVEDQRENRRVQAVNRAKTRKN